MESYLPSEIARLVYGYLAQNKCEVSARTFIDESPHLSECLNLVRQGKNFSTKLCGKSLIDLLEEYCIVSQLVSECVKELKENSGMPFQQVGSLVDHLHFLLKVVKSQQNVPQQASSQKNITNLVSLTSECVQTQPFGSSKKDWQREDPQSSPVNLQEDENSVNEFCFSEQQQQQSKITVIPIVSACSNVSSVTAPSPETLPGFFNNHCTQTVQDEENCHSQKRKAVVPSCDHSTTFYDIHNENDECVSPLVEDNSSKQLHNKDLITKSKQSSLRSSQISTEQNYRLYKTSPFKEKQQCSSKRKCSRPTTMKSQIPCKVRCSYPNDANSIFKEAPQKKFNRSELGNADGVFGNQETREVGVNHITGETNNKGAFTDSTEVTSCKEMLHVGDETYRILNEQKELEPAFEKFPEAITDCLRETMLNVNEYSVMDFISKKSSSRPGASKKCTSIEFNTDILCTMLVTSPSLLTSSLSPSLLPLPEPLPQQPSVSQTTSLAQSSSQNIFLLPPFPQQSPLVQQTPTTISFSLVTTIDKSKDQQHIYKEQQNKEQVKDRDGLNETPLKERFQSAGQGKQNFLMQKRAILSRFVPIVPRLEHKHPVTTMTSPTITATSATIVTTIATATSVLTPTTAIKTIISPTTVTTQRTPIARTLTSPSTTSMKMAFEDTTPQSDDLICGSVSVTLQTVNKNSATKNVSSKSEESSGQTSKPCLPITQTHCVKKVTKVKQRQTEFSNVLKEGNIEDKFAFKFSKEHNKRNSEKIVLCHPKNKWKCELLELINADYDEIFSTDVSGTRKYTRRKRTNSSSKCVTKSGKNIRISDALICGATSLSHQTLKGNPEIEVNGREKDPVADIPESCILMAQNEDGKEVPGEEQCQTDISNTFEEENNEEQCIMKLTSKFSERNVDPYWNDSSSLPEKACTSEITSLTNVNHDGTFVSTVQNQTSTEKTTRRKRSKSLEPTRVSRRKCNNLGKFTGHLVEEHCNVKSNNNFTLHNPEKNTLKTLICPKVQLYKIPSVKKTEMKCCTVNNRNTSVSDKSYSGTASEIPTFASIAQSSITHTNKSNGDIIAQNSDHSSPVCQSKEFSDSNSEDFPSLHLSSDDDHNRQSECFTPTSRVPIVKCQIEQLQEVDATMKCTSSKPTHSKSSHILDLNAKKIKIRTKRKFNKGIKTDMSECQISDNCVKVGLLDKLTDTVVKCGIESKCQNKYMAEENAARQIHIGTDHQKHDGINKSLMPKICRSSEDGRCMRTELVDLLPQIDNLNETQQINVDADYQENDDIKESLVSNLYGGSEDEKSMTKLGDLLLPQINTEVDNTDQITFSKICRKNPLYKQTHFSKNEGYLEITYVDNGPSGNLNVCPYISDFCLKAAFIGETQVVECTISPYHELYYALPKDCEESTNKSYVGDSSGENDCLKVSQFQTKNENLNHSALPDTCETNTNIELQHVSENEECTESTHVYSGSNGKFHICDKSNTLLKIEIDENSGTSYCPEIFSASPKQCMSDISVKSDIDIEHGIQETYFSRNLKTSPITTQNQFSEIINADNGPTSNNFKCENIENSFFKIEANENSRETQTVEFSTSSNQELFPTSPKDTNRGTVHSFVDASKMQDTNDSLTEGNLEEVNSNYHRPSVADSSGNVESCNLLPAVIMATFNGVDSVQSLQQRRDFCMLTREKQSLELQKLESVRLQKENSSKVTPIEREMCTPKKRKSSFEGTLMQGEKRTLSPQALLKLVDLDHLLNFVHEKTSSVVSQELIADD